VGRLVLTGAIVVITVSIVTLVGQGMTLPALVRRLRLTEHPERRIGVTTVRALEHELDLEEARLG
jgi:NhaP-type Na+/H+ or K+/H+ antiporter